MISRLGLQAVVCKRKQIPKTVAARYEDETVSEIIAGRYHGWQTKYLGTQTLQTEPKDKH